MDSSTEYNSITVTTVEDRNHVQFDVRHSEGDLKESIALSVIVPALLSQTLPAVQQAALRRAIELLQDALSAMSTPE